jgi:hypothetical protein
MGNDMVIKKTDKFCFDINIENWIFKIHAELHLLYAVIAFIVVSLICIGVAIF